MSITSDFEVHLEAARAAAKKTDSATVILDVGDVLSITSWFVITSASNTRLVRAIAGAIDARCSCDPCGVSGV